MAMNLTRLEPMTRDEVKQIEQDQEKRRREAFLDMLLRQAGTEPKSERLNIAIAPDDYAPPEETPGPGADPVV